MSPAQPFDLLGPLPSGTTLLEASAGTGKTFTIAGLVTRYVAEGVAAVDELLVVTFGRAATQELRDRVRERLVGARDALADVDAARGSDDALVAHLATGARSEIALRRARLAGALANFDSATVATTHEFCQQVLAGLGTAGDLDPESLLVDNLDDLLDEVVRDLYLRKWGQPDAGSPVFSLADALALARAVVYDGQARLVPAEAADKPVLDGSVLDGSALDGSVLDGSAPDRSAPDGSDRALVRRRFAEAVRGEMDRRKRAQHLLGFDDLLTRLQHTLADPGTGPAARTRLRARYQVVLVDEFQDTDPVQWDILRLAFHGAATLVLIGDPKQAIYAFRGADVLAYLAAAGVADRHATLSENWRSDADLLAGLDALFRGAALGDARIVVQPVRAAHPGRSISLPGAPVRLRIITQGGRPAMPVAAARASVVPDVVAQVTALLDGDTRRRPRDGSGERALVPGDIAVIVRTGAQLDLVHAALVEAGVPAVQRTTSSVFRTSAAQDWIVLLEALEQPHRSGRIRRLAVSSFVGWDAAELEHGDVDRVALRVRYWISVLQERGVAALFEAVGRDRRLAARLLAERAGERRMTDLRHIGESLHAAAMGGDLGLAALLEWLRRRVADAGLDSALDRSRRLDSDAAAVQVVTIHASKGLEFPVVLVPFGWDRFDFEAPIPLFHDAAGRRVRNVGGAGSPGFAVDQKRHRHEELGEDLRLLYVALTRAQSLAIAWWAPSTRNTALSPLHRLLFSDAPAVAVPERVPVPSDAVAVATLHSRALDGYLSVTTVEVGLPVVHRARRQIDSPLVARRFDREVDTTWRRTSYSALTASAHDPGPSVGSEPEVADLDDEVSAATVIAQPPADPGSDERLRAVPSPMAEQPGGTGFGTLVHAVLEAVDAGSDDLEAEVRTHVGVMTRRGSLAGVAAQALSAALLPALRTPLGELADGRSLSGIASIDRLSELQFELPLAGGDRPRARPKLGSLAPLLISHLAPADPMVRYAAMLADPVIGASILRGYLNGSIDAVVRIGGRYLVIDYKTNRLGTPGQPLTAWDYRNGELVEAMLRSHYPLQALLYEVALHRFLRWRIAGYDPAEHLGGVLYLFLRGMCGPGVVGADGSIPGVYAWRPPSALVVALSDALDGRG